MTKEKLRLLYKTKRKELLEKEKKALDNLLLTQVQQFNIKNIHTLLNYFPIASYGEPNTLLCAAYLAKTVPALQLCYPIIDKIHDTMQAGLVNDNTAYYKNSYGITEPATSRIINPADIDLIFVPLLAYDNKGYRVGYGKGFYDKYLSLCKKTVITIGFSYFEPVDKIDDTNFFDIPLNYCVTPTVVYEF